MARTDARQDAGAQRRSRALALEVAATKEKQAQPCFNASRGWIRLHISTANSIFRAAGSPGSASDWHTVWRTRNQERLEWV